MPVSNRPKGIAEVQEIRSLAQRGGNYSRKSQIPALSMGNTEALVPDFQQVELREAVIDESAARFVLAKANKVQFNTRVAQEVDNGSLGYWVGEGDGIGVFQMPVTFTTLPPYHIAGIVVETEEWLRHASDEAANALRRKLARALARQFDMTALDPTNAGTPNVKPAAWTYGAPSVETIRALADAFTGDWTKSLFIAQPQVLAALQSDVNPDVGFSGGQFAGLPAIASRYAPDSTLIVIDPSGITYSLGELEYEISRGDIQMVDAATQHSDGSPSSPSDDPVATQVVSLYATNSVAVKLSMYASWAVRSGSVAMVTFDESPGGSPL